MPVLVWFFGGALQWGYTSEMEFDGERIARRDVVVVTVNYRLNVFGFLAHPQLTKEQPEAPANFGNLDQQAGLKWVIRNIEAFGGDPDNITIAGQSAGGGSVLSQMASPQNKGLFQKAVVMSAMIRSPYGGENILIPRTLEEAETHGERFIKFLGVESIEEARKWDAFEILKKYNEYVQENGRMFSIVDGQFSVGDPLQLLARNESIDVPVMAGNTADEFPASIYAETEAEFRSKVYELFGEKAEQFLACEEVKSKHGDAEYARISGIEHTVKAVFEERQKRGNSQKDYYYRFMPDIPGKDNPGTFHSVDLWFFFETLAKCSRPYVGRHYDLSRQMCNYLCNFVKSGDPNGVDADGETLPVWEPYQIEMPYEMCFSADGAKGRSCIESEFTKIIKEHLKGSL